MPAELSVTSASRCPRRCALRYSLALLPKSFERPGPKSVRPATNCSDVDVVVSWKWISFCGLLMMHIVLFLSELALRLLHMQPAYHLQSIETTAFIIENCASPSAKTTNHERWGVVPLV